MILYNLHFPGNNAPQHLRVLNGKIVSLENNKNRILTVGGESCIDAGNTLAFPGLVNSHDHLEFNSFPALRTRIYSSYMEWGKDIHTRYKEHVNAVLHIPEILRIQWGIYKNLLNGITTVVHHGKRLPADESIISVFQQACSLHSIGLEKGWRRAINLPCHGKHPFVIHIGEGTDEATYREIDRLIRWNFLGRKIIGVHGVAMDERQAARFHALVWCPGPNYFLLDKTAPVDRLKRHTKILFGTDSTLSASWNIWEHLRLAREQRMVDDKELFDMLTLTPAEVWNLPGSGSLAVNQPANIVIAKPKKYLQGWDAFYALNPEDILLVLHQGNIRLIAPDFYEQTGMAASKRDLHKIAVNGKEKYVYGNLPALMDNILKYHPSLHFPISPGN